MLISANLIVLNRGERRCHVDVGERRKNQSLMIRVHAVAEKNTKIAVGNRHTEAS